ncbi:hypothetical protein CDEST_06283 [Colletotrichum destructivum]|uniref:Uncharacterized protein n=1 Tax=Colletotrichum destructivum TaxID=34406 RepID=A0AAX4IDD2_9PEZI|nr:hypothetical protein CDEST_06283 [Colletotrichum destructivum]
METHPLSHPPCCRAFDAVASARTICGRRFYFFLVAAPRDPPTSVLVTCSMQVSRDSTTPFSNPFSHHVLMRETYPATYPTISTAPTVVVAAAAL